MTPNNNKKNHGQGKAKHHLDITHDVCPMTFVKTKLLLERMAGGEIAEILLCAGEPLENVPRSAEEEGHAILAIEPAPGPRPDIYRILIRRA
ncbi:MAG: sulfurtransferase TusA family protein [Rhodospirillaceae bacterium]|nr:sulfurtransferase TusA family protein [Rhodospirillaceae bacterium]MBT5660256.1 sulfurtransferase TusA family protein [Rhodospirillaceae bacterium]MBT5751407.1 sulfurtransferase TusA family protein [Rhodospirillaceae bacterium]